MQAIIQHTNIWTVPKRSSSRLYTEKMKNIKLCIPGITNKEHWIYIWRHVKKSAIFRYIPNIYHEKGKRKHNSIIDYNEIPSQKNCHTKHPNELVTSVAKLIHIPGCERTAGQGHFLPLMVVITDKGFASLISVPGIWHFFPQKVKASYLKWVLSNSVLFANCLAFNKLKGGSSYTTFCFPIPYLKKQTQLKRAWST